MVTVQKNKGDNFMLLPENESGEAGWFEHPARLPTTQSDATPQPDCEDGIRTTLTAHETNIIAAMFDEGMSYEEIARRFAASASV
jgi:hypothetical protein